MNIEAFFDNTTATITYIISDPETKACAIIDPVYDFNAETGQLSTSSPDKLISYIKTHSLTLQWILETHIHADHLTAARYLKEKLGGTIAIGEHIVDVLAYWVPTLQLNDAPKDGSQFDALLKDGDRFKIGNLNVEVIHTPGHTPDSVSYHIEDCIFVGDSLFMPYVGTARTDFPGGGAAILYQSIQKILALSDDTRIYTGHDYPPDGQAPAFMSTVAEQKNKNIMVNEKVDATQFIEARNKRDYNKPAPKLAKHSIPFNLRAGKSITNHDRDQTSHH